VVTAADPATGHHIIDATLEAVLLKAGEGQLCQTPDYYWTNATKLDLRLWSVTGRLSGHAIRVVA
jgi:hypothetical protein